MKTLSTFLQRLNRRLQAEMELQVWQDYDRDGTVLWSAYNSRTGQSIHHVSEQLIRTWIEQSNRVVPRK